MNRRILAALAASTWLAGCVSILGVDADDHEDLGDVICGCTDAARPVCDAVLERAVQSAEVEQVLLDCAAKDPRCTPLDACIADVVRGRDGDRCSPEEKPNRVTLRCDEGLACSDAGRCEPSNACAPIGAPCGTGAACCNGLACPPDGVCPACGSPNDPCGDTACCDLDQPQVCSRDSRICLQCQPDRLGDCNADFPCCGTGECPLDGLCPP